MAASARGLISLIRGHRDSRTAAMSVVRNTMQGGRQQTPFEQQATAQVADIGALEKYHSLSDRDKLNLIFSTKKTQAFSMMMNLSENPYAVYRDLVDMGRAGIVASYLDIVTNDATKTSPVHNQKVWVEETKGPDGQDYSKDIEELFDEIGVEDRVWQWTHEMCHFGDKFLKPAISRDKGIISLRDDFAPVDVLRVEFDGRLGAFVFVDPDYSLSSTPMYGYGGMEFQQSSVSGPDSFVHMMINNMSAVSKVVINIPMSDIEEAAERNEDKDSWMPRFAKSLKESRDRTQIALREAAKRSADDPSKLFESLSFFGASLTSGDSIENPFVEMGDARIVVSTRRGWSILMNSRRDYRLLNMGDQAMALARFARAPQMRVFYIDTTGASVTERDEMIDTVEKRVNRSMSFDSSRQLYQDQYSPAGFTDDMFIPVTGQRGDMRVETIGGDVDVRAMVDIEYLLGRWFAAVHMPKAFMGFEEMLPGFNSAKSLTALDIRYASVTDKVQSSTIRSLKRLANIHLKYKHGVDVPVKGINVKMQKGSTAEESELLENQEAALAIIERKLEFIEKAGGNVQAAAKDMLKKAGLFDNDTFDVWMTMGDGK